MAAQQRAELYQLTRMLWWRHELGQLSDEALEALLDVLNGARHEIVKRIRAELEGLVSVSEWRKDYDQQVVAWLNEVTAAARGTVTSLITETSIGVALASVETYNSILSFEGAATSVKLVSGLTRDQVRQFFVDQPLGGRLLSEWVDRSFTSGAQQLMFNAIRTGVMQGESYRKLERRVMDAAAQGFGITQREAATLVRTYVQSANTGAQEAVYKQNEDIITGYKRVETLDNHTCQICALMDGAKYGLHEKKPDLPAHPNCRGVYLPLLKSFRELGLDMDEFEEVARPWAIVEYRYTFKKDPTRKLKTPKRTILRYGQFKGTAEEWIRTLPPKEQLPFFPSDFAYELWSKNIIKAIDLIDKNTWKVRTDTELENLIK